MTAIQMGAEEQPVISVLGTRKREFTSMRTRIGGSAEEDTFCPVGIEAKELLDQVGHLRVLHCAGK